MEFGSSLSQEDVEQLFLSTNPMQLVVAVRKAVSFGDYFESQLISLLDHDFYEVRAYSSRALGRIGAYDSLPHLLQLLTDEVESVRFSVVESLQYFQDESMIIPLIKVYTDYSREAQRLATIALSKQDSQQLKQAFQDWFTSIKISDYLMEDDQAITRIDSARGIVEACGELPFPWVSEILQLGLVSEDLEMVRLAAISIGNQQLSQFANQLLKLRNHEDDDVRLAIVYALSRIELPQKSNILLEYQEDSYEFIRQILASYLPRIGKSEDIGMVIGEFITSEISFVKATLAESLRSVDYLEYLQILLDDQSAIVRKAAAKSLGTIPSPFALEILSSHEEQDELVRIAIENALKNLENDLIPSNNNPNLQ